MATDDPLAMDAPAGSGQPYLGTRPGGRSARVRSAVIAAAAAEVAEHGYDGFSIPRVAERAGRRPDEASEVLTRGGARC